MADNSDALARPGDGTARPSGPGRPKPCGRCWRRARRSPFAGLARRAGVSVSLLYADRDLAARVAEARDRQRQAGRERAWRLPARSLATEQSLCTELTNAKEQVRQLHEEVVLLRQRLARSLGTDADAARGRATAPLLDQLEDRAEALEAASGGLRRRISELETELREANDSLEAARVANRDLMALVNR